MKFRPFLLFLTVAIALTAASCGGGSKKKRAEQEFFVHGNPLDLIANTTRSPSFLTPDNLKTYDGFHLSSSVGFIEVEPLQKASGWEEVEKSNSTEATETEVNNELALVPYTFRQESAARWVYAPAVASDQAKLGFSLVDGKLIITDIDGYAVQSEHYSLKNDGRSFSVLFSTRDNHSGRILLAFYFAASDVVNPILKGSQDYQFLIGNAKIPVEGELSLDTCGTADPAIDATVVASLGAWFEDPSPSATRKTVSHQVRLNAPPFSDLNTQCVLAISNFKLENMREFYVGGATIPIYNRASKTVIDSDIMMFMDQPRIASSMRSGQKSETLTHEIGHFFGLGHEFRVTSDGKAPLHESIMGYSRGTSVVTAWDFEAIRDLYGSSLGAKAP